jgi:GT2 family glycosyltransferase
MDVSVVIVNWNTRELVADCIRSVLDQISNYAIEVIVVDNGSEDGSQEVVRREFPGVNLIENKVNLGFAKANNVGIRAAKGRYLCLVNSDVRVMAGCIDALATFMDSHLSVGLCGPQILWPDMSIQDSCRNSPSLWNNFCSAIKLNKLFPNSSIFSGEHMLYFSHDQEVKADYLAGCFLMLRKDALDQVGLFDEQFFIYAEEMDLAKRLWSAGWKVVFIPEARAVHHHGASSSRDPVRFSLEQQKAVLKYWRKHSSSFTRLVFVLLLVFQYLVRAILSIVLYLFRPKNRVQLAQKLWKNIALLSALFKLNDTIENV